VSALWFEAETPTNKVCFSKSYVCVCVCVCVYTHAYFFPTKGNGILGFIYKWPLAKKSLHLNINGNLICFYHVEIYYQQKAKK
jgi:hypothetical protein